MATLGQNIQRLRQRPGFDKSRQQLAEVIGTKYQAVYDWENDRRRSVDSKTLLKLARGLDATVEQLLDGVDDEYEKHKRELIRHDSDQSSGLPPGGPNVVVAAASRILEVEELAARLLAQLADNEIKAGEMRAVAQRIIEIAAVGGEGHEAAEGISARGDHRRRHR